MTNLSGNLSASVISTPGGSEAFPEQTPAFLASSSDCGICFSGGGTRSLAACMGQMRALNALGVLENARYISCVSGGSWASAAYTCYKSGPADDSELLGPVVSATERACWSLDQWAGSLKPHELGFPATADFAGSLEHYATELPHDEAWLRAVRDTYFAPYGLDDWNFFSDSGSMVSEILNRNKALQPAWQEADFDSPRPGRPYLIINTTLLWPVSFLHHVNRVLFQITPRYVGNPCEVTLTKDDVFHKRRFETGGGFLDTFAFGSSGPSEPAAPWLEMPVPTQPFPLWRASGYSSSAFAYDLAEVDLLTSFIPRHNYWAVSKSTSSQKVTGWEYFADGGNLENLGIMALLQRKVKQIVVFDNSEIPISRKKGKIHVGTSIPPLFGIDNKHFPHNQVFDSADYKNTVDELWKNFSAGKLTTAKLSYVTKPNSFFGIEQYRVTVLWVHNSLVGNWVSELSASTQNAVNEGARGQQPLADFPNFRTIDENGLMAIRLRAEQVALIADMFSWSIEQESDQFIEMLNAP